MSRFWIASLFGLALGLSGCAPHNAARAPEAAPLAPNALTDVERSGTALAAYLEEQGGVVLAERRAVGPTTLRQAGARSGYSYVCYVESGVCGRLTVLVYPSAEAAEQGASRLAMRAQNARRPDARGVTFEGRAQPRWTRRDAIGLTSIDVSVEPEVYQGGVLVAIYGGRQYRQQADVLGSALAQALGVRL